MSFANLIFVSGIIIFTLMTFLWLLSLVLRNSSIVDIFWGLGFVIVVWVSYFLTDGYVPRKLLVVALTTLWGSRLAIHIGIRNRGRPEDFRYAKWRQESGENWWWYSYFKVFLLQGILMLVISTPLLAVQTAGDRTVWNFRDLLGAFLWIIGFLFESISDHQLAQFKADPANEGKILTSGLWRYTRHPNYFGEAVLWWGYYLFALASGTWWTICSPILMTWLLVKVSGVALLEQAMKHKPGYKDYIRNTNAFLPWFPKY